MPTMYAKEFATEDDHIKDYFSWDKDGITFVIDNSATVIISSQSRLFTGPLIPRSATLETAEGLTTKTKLVFSMKLIITDDSNKNHSCKPPRCLFDPNIPVNILGVPAIGKIFGDNADANDPLS